ncbi:MAG: glycosyltransferase family 39 protein [Candidatus Margulisbacteria bacterium]|nr:glycosyltransferase family 39 protein [Candidatus Margulisiibacteriota bacterium]
MNIKIGNLRLNVAVSLVILSSILFFFKLGSFSLYDAAETTYGEFVKNILNSGDWLTLHYNGQVIFDKPPLYFWLAALLSKLIGFNEWAMRFWAALAGVLTVITTYLLGRKFYNERTGFLAGIIVMTAFQFLVQSRIAELDIVLTLFMTLSVYLFYLGYTSGERKYYLLSYFPMALAMLIKGLLGVALPAFAIFLFLLFKKELGKIKEFYVLPGLLIIALIGLPWYIIEYLIHGKVFLDFALGFLFMARFQGVVSGHTGPWYYYFLALLLGFAPWSQFLPLGLWRAWKLRTHNSELLTLCFIVPAFIVFSIAKTKIPNYVLPLYPFLAIMVASQWDRFFAKPKERRGFLISNLFFAVVVGLIFIGVIILGNSNYPAQYAALMPGLLTLAAILVAGSLVSIVFFLAKADRLSFASIPIMVFAIALVLTLHVLPQVETFKGAKPLGTELGKVIKANQAVAAYETGNRPSVVLHSPQPVVFLEKEADLDSYLAARKGFAFTTTDEYEKIKSRLPRGVKIFDQKGDLLVIYKP